MQLILGAVMRHVPKFIQTEDNQILEIDGYAHGMFQIKNHAAIKAYHSESGYFCADPHGLDKLQLMAKTPDTFREWQEIYKKKVSKAH